MRFLSSGFIYQSTPFGPLFFSNSVSNSLSYLNSKFELRYGPLPGTNFFSRYQGFKTWVVYALASTVYIHIRFYVASLSL
jgi:hypothetical protein